MAENLHAIHQIQSEDAEQEQQKGQEQGQQQQKGQPEGEIQPQSRQTSEGGQPAAAPASAKAVLAHGGSSADALGAVAAWATAAYGSLAGVLAHLESAFFNLCRRSEWGRPCFCPWGRCL
jgi:transcription initiation factor TFIID subunit TAF12